MMDTRYLVGAACGAAVGIASYLLLRRFTPAPASAPTVDLSLFPAHVQEALKVFDDDGDGKIDQEELVRAAKLYAQRKKATLAYDHERASQLAAREGAAAQSTRKRVYTVCLTGGPCSGKSSSLSSFVKELTSRGFDVYTVPEVPTLVMNSGFPYPGMAPELEPLLFDFEQQLFKMQLLYESTVVHMAARRDALLRQRPCVIVLDRGLMDMRAYMTPQMWQAILAGEGDAGLTEDAVRARYDLVIHLVTAADGAEAFYTTANNAARTETAEMARENDRRVQVAWEGHGNWRRVTNAGSFEDKVEEATRHVINLVTN